MKEGGESKSKFKKFWKDFWFIVWKDNSTRGWIISIIFLFIIIKFVFFPLLELSTGTALPLVIVESCSMHHSGTVFSNFESWWNRHEDKYEDLSVNQNLFEDFPMKRGFTKGDILFVTRANPEKLEVGDVIIFEAGYRNPIIHRIIDIKEKNGEYIFSTIGDNNNGQLTIEKEIRETQLIGKARLTILPYFGWVKLIFFEINKSSSERGFCEEN